VRVAAFVALIVGLTGAGGSSGATDPWKELYRPLQVPRLDPGDACRISTVDPSVDFASFRIGPGVGRGPAYPAGRNVSDGTLELAPPKRFESGRWGGNKVGWFVHPRYRGPVLIRGRQLDGPYRRVRFGRGNIPPLEFRIVPGETQQRGGRADGTYTRLRAAGCYGYQIDGTTFSRVIVFRAEWIR
jgi:hypothetical protein